jgi:osmotically-inducible protein OsmY
MASALLAAAFLAGCDNQPSIEFTGKPADSSASPQGTQPDYPSRTADGAPASPAASAALADALLGHRVREIFAQDLALKDQDIKVDVKSGIVTLVGTVDSADKREHAEVLAETLTGVKSVVNQLGVGAHS